MTTLHTKPRELEARLWNGSNREEIQELTRQKGPSPDSRDPRLSDGAQFRTGDLLSIWNGRVWVDVPKGWWVVDMEEGGLARMSPDYVRLYMSEDPAPAVKEYYESYKASRDRLERVSIGVENLALEIATVQGQPNLGRYIQDRLRQLLCTHPETQLRYGAAQTWCSICFLKLEPGDTEARNRETMAHVVTWCRCDTSACAVHHENREELPAPTIVVPAIPEAKRAPALAPANELVILERSSD